MMIPRLGLEVTVASMSFSIEPRVVPVPVRMPLPPALHQGSIYENQTAIAARRASSRRPQTFAL